MGGEAEGLVGGFLEGDVGLVVGEFVGADDVSIGETVGAKVMGWMLGDALGRVVSTSVGGEVGG